MAVIGRLLLFLFFTTNIGCYRANKTTDIVDGVYKGYLIDGELEDKVTIKDERSRLEINFYEFEGDQWIDIAYYGSIQLKVPVFGLVDVWGPEEDSTRDLEIVGDDLTCNYSVRGIKLHVDGEFYDQDEELILDIKKIGSIPLILED